MSSFKKQARRAYSVSLAVLVLIASASAQDADSSEQRSGKAAETAQFQSLESRVLDLEDQLVETKALALISVPGENQFLWSGYGFTRFTDAEGASSTFSSVLAPLVLYKVGDRLLFEGEFEFELEFDGEGETHVEIEYMNASYLLTDNITLGTGLFLTPFGIFNERVHPAWINKLPDGPLIAGHDGIVPSNSLGAYARGAFRTGSTKWNYAAYVSNGPRLNTGVDEPDEAGLLHFDNYEDVNDGKSVGGRIGVLPTPQLELGASVLTGDVASSGSGVGNPNALLYGVDFSYNEPRLLGGRMEVRGEWTRSGIEDATYDPDGSLGFGPLIYDNERSGGWVQAAYRPAWSTSTALSKCEGVVRWDWLERPSGAPEFFDQQRWTLGLNYWVNASSVMKAAYRIDDRDSGEEAINALLLQFAVGF